MAHQAAWSSTRSALPMGRNGGQLAGVRGDQLLAECLNGLSKRQKLDPALVEDVVGGCVTQIQEQGVRYSPGRAQWPAGRSRSRGDAQPAVRLGPAGGGVRGHGDQSGQAGLTVGCGMESMSRVAMGSDVGTFNENP